MSSAEASAPAEQPTPQAFSVQPAGAAPFSNTSASTPPASRFTFVKQSEGTFTFARPAVPLSTGDKTPAAAPATVPLPKFTFATPVTLAPHPSATPALRSGNGDAAHATSHAPQFQKSLPAAPMTSFSFAAPGQPANAPTFTFRKPAHSDPAFQHQQPVHRWSGLWHTEAARLCVGFVDATGGGSAEQPGASVLSMLLHLVAPKRTDALATQSVASLIWQPIEVVDPRVSLVPLGAFFSLAEERYDRPNGFHTPPPLPPMVHAARMPKEYALREIAVMTGKYPRWCPRHILLDDVPLGGFHTLRTLLAVDSPTLSECSVAAELMDKLCTPEAEQSDDDLELCFRDGVVLRRLVDVVTTRIECRPADSVTMWYPAEELCISVLGRLCDVNTIATQVVTAGGLNAFNQVATQSADALMTRIAAYGLAKLARRTQDADREDAVKSLLVAYENHKANLSTVSHITWALEEYCRRPKPDYRYWDRLVNIFVQQLDKKDDSANYAIAALSYLSDGPSVEVSMTTRTLPRAVAALPARIANKDDDFIHYAVRLLGNVAVSSDEQTQALIDADALPHCTAILQRFPTFPHILKEVCWLFSNVFAGTRPQITAAIQAGSLPVLVQLLQNESTPHNVLKEVLWCMANLAAGGSFDHVATAVRDGALAAVAGRLSLALGTGLKPALDALAEAFGIALDTIDEAEGDDQQRLLRDVEQEWLGPFAAAGPDALRSVMATSADDACVDLASTALERFEALNVRVSSARRE